MNIKFDFKRLKNSLKRLKKPLFAIAFVSVLAGISIYNISARAAEVLMEPVQACVIARDKILDDVIRAKIAHCLGWEAQPNYSICNGYYKPLTVQALASEDEVYIQANRVSLYEEGRSKLSGDVEIQQPGRVVNAQTAYVYRDAKSNKVTAIELFGEVRYLEPDKLMIARKAMINPQDKSGTAEDVLYRFNSQRPNSPLPAWGQASLIERYPNKDYLLKLATYTTCAPQDNAWHLEAKKITLDNAKAMGVARDARLFVGNTPILYTPYWSFPTSKERKSGFLMPTIGSTSMGGLDFSLPYYWNMAPNYDATFTPHIFSRRGLMMGGQFRFLTERSYGQVNAKFLPNDRAFRQFLFDNQLQYPELRNVSSDRWAIQVRDLTRITPDLLMRINYQQVSDDYFLQDFSANLAVLTERQIQQEGELLYNTEHWLFRGLLQSYQTLQPINQTPIGNIYQRLPQLYTVGSYDDLLFNSNFTVHGQFDNFYWPNDKILLPEGPRYYVNPILSIPYIKPWGFITPSIEVVQNYYEVRHFNGLPNAQFGRTIPRYSLDTGLFFERDTHFLNQSLIQTLEPHLFYLKVPYHDQTPIPVYDSGYYIFNIDQLFRNNRYSGLDRIGDSDQISYSVTTRWLTEESGAERASFALGQIRYFADRRVKLCQNINGNCEDNPLVLGYLSPIANASPIASRGIYHFNPFWALTGDYVWDPYTRSTNNGNVNFRYQPGLNQLVGVGYTYMTFGDITQVAKTNPNISPLHQLSFSYAWPFTERWSSLGAYSYNISKGYDMMSVFGIQYDNCCWAVRLLGGRSFSSLSPELRPQYNNNVFLQVQLKGLGSVGNSDPASVIRTYIPGYVDSFHR